MSEDESIDSFYSKLNEVIIGKFNLGEKTEDSKIVRKILQSLPKSFHSKVKAIKESKDLNDITLRFRTDAHGAKFTPLLHFIKKYKIPWILKW